MMWSLSCTGLLALSLLASAPAADDAAAPPPSGAASATSAAQTPPAFRLVMSGFAHARGQAIIMVFAEANADGYPTKYDQALRTLTVPIPADLTVQVNVGPLPPGTYAVRVHHDEDGDGKLAKRWLRPAEGLGFSKDADFRTFGPPTFADAAIIHPQPEGIVRITRMRYP